MRVLVVEDELRLASNIAEALRQRCGYAVDCAATGTDGLSLPELGNYDLLLLDLMLPGVDGFSIVQRLRRSSNSTPILILTARDERSQVIQLLNAGADDYLTKPYCWPE
jgi:two-component system response regulator PhoP